MKTTDTITADFLSEDTCALIAKWNTVRSLKWDPIYLKNNTLEELEEAQKFYNKEIAFILPFCSVRREWKWEAHGDEPILAFAITEEQQYSRDTIIQALPDTPIGYSDITTDISDETFMQQVQSLQGKIWEGEVCQTILSRAFETQLTAPSNETYLNIYKKLLEIPGGYMTFLMQFWDTIITWASPEVHLRVEDGFAHKSPLAGTVPKKNPDMLAADILNFLDNRKEQNELCMVTDEELKMLEQICESGKISWPFLKEIGKVIHTGYNFRGKLKDGISPIDALRHTLFSPTIVGWPIESAFKQICHFETQSRWYYGTALWILGHNFLDSAIPIRTAQIMKNDGKISVRAGAWVVSESDPFSETKETEQKAQWLLWVFDTDPSLYESQLPKLSKNDQSLIQEKLDLRGAQIPHFHSKDHTDSVPKSPDNESILPFINSELIKMQDILRIAELEWKTVCIIHNWDDFSFTLQHMMECMWMEVNVLINSGKNIALPDTDIVLLWPGYWNINDSNNPKMKELQSITKQLILSDRAFTWVCLWHQAICKALWSDIVKQKKATQWAQREILLKGKKQTVWMYNSFAPQWKIDSPDNIIKDDDWNILFLKKQNIASCQFHPESIMTQNGYEILRDMLKGVLDFY
jgi:2-amino-4-deoxychorismate synthase